MDRLMDEIENVDWKEVTLSKEPNEAYNIFYEKLINSYNKTIPLKTLTNKESKQLKK